MNEIETKPEAWLTMILRHVCHLMIIFVFIDLFASVTRISLDKYFESLREQSKSQIEWLQSPIQSR